MATIDRYFGRIEQWFSWTEIFLFARGEDRQADKPIFKRDKLVGVGHYSLTTMKRNKLLVSFKRKGSINVNKTH